MDAFSLNFLRNLRPKTKRIAVFGLISAIFVSVIWIASREKGRKNTAEEAVGEKIPRSLEIKPKWIEETRLQRKEEEVSGLRERLEGKRLEEAKAKLELEGRIAALEKRLTERYGIDPEKAAAQAQSRTEKPYPAPAIRNRSKHVSAPSAKKLENSATEGGIVRLDAESEETSEIAKAEGAKERMGTYLPPSFMGATLLSGVDAPVMEQARDEPVPIIIRIKSPAFLPNDAKKDMKGCFVIGDGTGSLASERLYIKTVLLSCVKKDGGSFIEEKIKGFVLDGDGKLGLTGKPVAKFGSALARTFLSGMLEGFGETMSQSAISTTTSSTGTVTATADGGEIKTRALGKGLATTSKKMSEFYMDLARMSMPVIEVGSKRDIAVVLREGIFLNFKENERKRK